jgi:peptidoglycan/LPS O-acetylase OafA/YrhL
MTHPTLASESRANPWLDFVRALAIVLVLFRHGQRQLFETFGGDQNVLQVIALNGWIGVDLLFVLSGYLISRHLLRAGIGTPGFAWGRYLTLRALRIVPAYYAVLLLTAAGTFALFPVSQGGLGFRLAYHLLFLQDYLPSDINVVFWSLGVEEKFYLIAPFLIAALLACRSSAMRFAWLVTLFAMPTLIRGVTYDWSGGEFTYAEFWRSFRSPFHMSLEGFVMGVGIALAEHEGLVRRSARGGSVVITGTLAALCGLMATHDFMAQITLVDIWGQPPLISLLCGGLVLGAVMRAGTPMPAARPAQGVAKLSYSLYLIHFPLIPVVVALALPHGVAAFWLTYVAVSFAAAFLLYAVVEKPFLLWKDQVAARTRPIDAQPAQTSAR